MEVEVRYFAGAREAAGLQAERLTLPSGSDVAALLTALVERHPTLAAWRDGLRVAIDEAFAEADTPLEAGSVVALIPPVGGG